MTQWRPSDQPSGEAAGRPPGQPAGQPGGDQGREDTARIPESEQSRHRYGQPADGPERAPYPPPYASSHPGQQDTTSFGGLGFGGDQPSQQTRPGQRSGRPANGVIAGILAAALALGGLAGVAGAAGFTAIDDLVNDDSPTTSSSSPSSSSVVDRKDVAPAADSVEAVARKVLPSVVKINVTGSQEQGSGSGIVISSDGEILTNNHVASVAGQGGSISVSFNDGSAKKARIIGTDPQTDLAVIKAEGVSGLTPATIGKSGQISVGENVVAIGSPFGLQATVTSGIVLNRPVSVQPEQALGLPGQATGQDTTYPAIQTDAAINPGNSGGPLVDLDGDVVGINSSIRTASSGGLDESSGGSIGLGFAIPIDNVWPIVQQLRKGETATHARMGVSVTDASANGGLLTGAGIQAVNDGSAAEDAGLKKGDVITKVDGQVITDSQSLVATVRGHRPGDTVTLTVVRGGDDTRTVKVKLDSDEGSASS
jgi:putative serine protease PepD